MARASASKSPAGKAPHPRAAAEVAAAAGRGNDKEKGEKEKECTDCSKSGLSMAPNNNNNNNRSLPLSSSPAVKKEPCSWFEIHHLVKEVARQIRESGKKYDCILGVGNGGIIPARLLAEELGMDAIHVIPVRKKQVVESEMPPLDRSKRYLIVDDICDTGSTFEKVDKALGGLSLGYAACMSRYRQAGGGRNVVSGRVLNHDRWMVFPWEQEIR